MAPMYISGRYNEYKVISLDKLLEKDLKSEPIIEGVLDRRESLEICGKGGVGKSVLSLNIGLYLACPHICSSLLSNEGPPYSLFGLWSIPKSVKTLFIQSENSSRATIARAEKIFSGNPKFREGADKIFMPIDNNDEIIISGPLTDSQFQDAVMNLITSCSIDVVIIDPLISFHDKDENDNARMRESLNCLTEIMTKTRVATIIIHHVGKNNTNNEGRGASSIGDWAHNIMLVDNIYVHKGETGIAPALRVTHTKSRNHELTPEFALIRDENLIYRRCSSGEKEESHEKELKGVVAALQALGGKTDTQAELVESVVKIVGCKTSKAKELITGASVKKLIMPVQGGKTIGYRLSENV